MPHPPIAGSHPGTPDAPGSPTEPSPRVGTRPDLVHPDSGPLAKALARQSPDLWQRLCEKSGGRPPALCVEKENKPVGLTKRYRTREKVGQGSTSVVYRAVRRVDDKQVALKTMRSRAPEACQLAREEYELLRRIRHPHIVRAVELQSVGDHAVLVLEYFEGVQLGTAVRESVQGCLAEAASRRLGVQLARAVEYLHRHGVVHRDIQPQNVLVRQDLRTLCLMDLGSATGASATGSGCAKPPIDGVLYAAPEVLLGEPPSEGSDVWQMGLCLHLMICGRLPQRRERCEPLREAMRAVATQHVSLSGVQWRHITPVCKAVLQRCLCIDKHERPRPSTLLREGPWLRLPPEELEPEECRSPGSAALLGGLEATQPDVAGKCAGFESIVQYVSQETTRPPSCNSISTRCSGHGSGLSSPAPAAGAPLAEEPSSEVVLVGPERETATILVVNYADRTYKVRLRDGRIQVVSAEDIRLL